MTQQEISDLCAASLANVLRIARDRVKTDAKFSRLGLDSAMVVYVMLEIEEKLDLTKNQAPSQVEADSTDVNEQKNTETQTKTHSPRPK